MRLFLISLCLCFVSACRAEVTPVSAPDWQLQTPAGKTMSLHDYRGKPLIILFWATWCPYCKKLMPGLQRLQEKYRDQGLNVVMIDFNEDDDADVVATLLARGIHLPTVIAGDETARRYQVQGTPTTFYIDRKGMIIGRSNNSDPDAAELTHFAEKLIR